jgi:RHS repeat-associated protein
VDCYSHRIDCSTGNTILGLGYDAQGNLANWNGKVHNFDYGNRLRSVTDVESYRYDAHGRRIRAWTPSAGLLYSLYSQAGQLLWQRDSRASRRREYVYLNGSLVAERTRPIGGTAETITYQHTDALGTPVLKTSASRVILERREYEPYGKLLNLPLESGPGFTGHDTDPDTQYTYMQQRYYDPRVGRFWSVDPVTAYDTGDWRLFNRYSYAFNNSYKFNDTDGRCPWCAGAAGGAIVGGIAGGMANYAASGGNIRQTVAGVIGGAVGGAITGGTLGAGTSIGASTGLAISSAIAGDAVAQIAENVVEHGTNTAIYSYNIERTALAGVLGAPLGPTSVLVEEVAETSLNVVQKQAIPAALGVLIQVPAAIAIEPEPRRQREDGSSSAVKATQGSP